jgi:hypothetical protein
MPVLNLPEIGEVTSEIQHTHTIPRCGFTHFILRQVRVKPLCMVPQWSERGDRIICKKIFSFLSFCSFFTVLIYCSISYLFYYIIFILLYFFTSFSYFLCSCPTFLQCFLYLIAVSLSFLFYFYRLFSYCVSPFLSYVVAYVSLDVSSNKEESNFHICTCE